MDDQTTTDHKLPSLRIHGEPLQVAALFAALAKAKANFGVITKNRKVTIKTTRGSDYEFVYADLEESLKATTKALSEQGLSVIQPVLAGELHTLLTHADGAYIQTVVYLPDADDIKTHGGNQTYLRRYSYNALLCLAADSDADDLPDAKRGEESAKASPRRTPQAPKEGERRAPLADTSSRQGASEMRPQASPGASTTSPTSTTAANSLTDDQRAKLKGAFSMAGISSREDMADVIRDVLGAPVSGDNVNKLIAELGKLAIAGKESANET